MDDWREQEQEKYLSVNCFEKSKYFIYRTGWDHDHCEYCGLKFCLGNDCETFGYYSKKGYYWVCVECWNDFHVKHNLKLCKDEEVISL